MIDNGTENENAGGMDKDSEELLSDLLGGPSSDPAPEQDDEQGDEDAQVEAANADLGAPAEPKVKKGRISKTKVEAAVTINLDGARPVSKKTQAEMEAGRAALARRNG
jgi:hypothetical protein